MTHSHYGDTNHRIRHFMLKGIAMLVVAAIAPALLRFPDPDRFFHLGIGIGICGWFLIIALGELLKQQKRDFHARRIFVHALVLAWVFGFTWWYSRTMLDHKWTQTFVMLAAMSATYPTIALLSHIRRFRRHLREANQPTEANELSYAA